MWWGEDRWIRRDTVMWVRGVAFVNNVGGRIEVRARKQIVLWDLTKT